ncbi:MAG: PAAR-like domain-containing protein [Planctomycetota bacterium]
MFAAANAGQGQNKGMPDVCNTPAGPSTVPVPYPNMASLSQANGFSQTVFIAGLNALNTKSKIPMTSGDEAGSAHNTTKGEAAFTQGAQTVFVEGAPAIPQMAQANGNKQNCAMAVHDTPCQTNVFYACSTAQHASLDSLCAAVAGNDGPRLAVSRRGVAVARVRIPLMTTSLPLELTDVMRHLARQRSVARVELDLRDTPGGDMIAALQAAATFAVPGRRLATLHSAAGAVAVSVSQRAPAAVFAGPLRVIVNRMTASSAELFAIALRRAARAGAAVVGGPTMGKRSVWTRDGAGSVPRVVGRFD